MAEPIHLTDQTFQKEVLEADKPVLIDFWAVWCGPCRVIAPTVTALADEWADRLKVCKLDVDHNQVTAQQYRIRSIPTMLLFKNGQVVESIVGALPRSKIEAKIAPHL
jgi:thioredoxin 1